MSLSNFRVIEHKVAACHIREYPGSTAANQEEVLQLHVKQYVPLDLPVNVPSNAVTLITAPGIGLPKEIYEPLWDELLIRSKRHGFCIRGIWIADATNMGASGIMNEHKLSTDTSWMDHARDLLLVTNRFREQMPRPLMGFGHSFGGTVIVNLAYVHPRLFSTVLLLEPVIQLAPAPLGLNHRPTGVVNFELYRPDVWPNREAAAAAQKRLLRRWDQRCLDLMARYGFRDLPTALHPHLPEGSDPENPPVTLTTTKYQNVLTGIRENFGSRDADGRIQIDRATHADMDPLAASVPLYRAEPISSFQRLPSLRPSALFMLGSQTFLNLDEMRHGIQVCGSGVGGGGGIREGKVKEVLVQGYGHLFPFEAVGETADHCTSWLEQELDRFSKAENDWNKQRAQLSQRDHLVLDKRWFQTLKPPAGMATSVKSGKEKL